MRAGDLGAEDITRLLEAWAGGDAEARDRLMPIVYGELRRRAASYLRRESGARTLQPTELVHETYLRLRRQSAGWKNRDHFFGVAAHLMRRILVDRARARKAAKRGGGLPLAFSDGMAPARSESVAVDVMEIDRALADLTALDGKQGRLVELRFFGGLTSEEAARALGISLATANREWAHAKAWLFRRLKAVSTTASSPT